MNKLSSKEVTFSKSRRQIFLLPLAILGSQIIAAEVVAAPDSITTREVEEGCPLNSGGSSLLGTKWRVNTVYGNRIPQAVNMIMKVNKNSLSGETGCNSYAASFQQVGNTGFRVTRVNKSTKGCRVIRPVKGGPTFNIGDLEGGYLRTLRRMGSVQQVGNNLVFYNRSGNRGIVMTPIVI